MCCISPCRVPCWSVNVFICIRIHGILISLFSIEGVVEKWGINETFVGLILLPIVGK